MASGIDEGQEQARQANELYWTSDESVNRIADRLGLSKGSLYAAIEPKPSDSLCPTCEGQLVYANRTAVQRNTLSCTKCSQEFTLRRDSGSVRRPQRMESPPESATLPARSGTGRGDRTQLSEDRSPASGQLVLGTTFIALGTGLLLSRLVRKG